MNRRTELFDDRLADWLEDDPVEAPPQLLATVLAAVPSIPQRRGGLAWRPRPLAYPWQLAAAAIVVVLVSVLGLLVLRLPAVGPKASPTAPAGLPDRIDVPLRSYSINLPPGWRVDLSPGAAGVDTFNGPEGALEVALALIPAGTGQEAWADAYFAAEMATPGGCSGVSVDSWEDVRVGQQEGRLYSLQCLPAFMALTAVGDRGYDIRFFIRGGTSVETAATVFRRILLAMFLGQGATPPLALSTFTSSRYGITIGYPTGWKVTPAARGLGRFDIPWWSGNEQVDLFEGPGAGTSPEQPASGILAIAATTLPPGTTLEDYVNGTAGVECGRKTGTPVSVDGEAASIIEYDNCQGDFHEWVTLIHEGRGYSILWLDAPANLPFDRVVFQEILATFRFTGPATSARPAAPATP